MLRASILLIPCVFLIGFLLHVWNNFTGASMNLVPRQYALFVAAWGVALILAWVIMRVLRIRGTTLSIFGRCVIAVILFWPLFGLGMPVAEEWTIQHRKATWDGPSDMGWSYMYGEMSGMGYASGLMHGWRGVLSDVKAWSLWGIVFATIWLPFLALESFILTKVWPLSRPDQDSDTNAALTN